MLTMSNIEITPTTLTTGQQFKVSVEVTSKMTWAELAKTTWDKIKTVTWAQIKGV